MCIKASLARQEKAFYDTNLLPKAHNTTSFQKNRKM
jgi:hypothetical protein